MIRSAREAKLWEDITPDMMSEEEKCDDTYVRHPPSYRSKAVYKFLCKLDNRCEKQMSTHPRVKRLLGSPRKLSTPCHAKRWVVKKIESQQQISPSQTVHAHSVVDNSDDTIQNSEAATEDLDEATFSGNAHGRLEENSHDQSFSSDFSISSSEDDHED